MSNEWIERIKKAQRKTMVKIYSGKYGVYDRVYIGDYEELKKRLPEEELQKAYIEVISRNQAIDLLNIVNLDARIEPGAIIREEVEIGFEAIVMMGAILNIGARIGEQTMIDMGAVIGGRAEIGKRCHIGANAVIAGVIEPASALPVVIEDDVLIGANAVVLEGVRVKKGAVVGAGAIVTKDVEENCVVVGVPAKVIDIRKNEFLEKGLR